VEDSKTANDATPAISLSITSRRVYAEFTFRVCVAGRPLFSTHLLSKHSTIFPTAQRNVDITFINFSERCWCSIRPIDEPLSEVGVGMSRSNLT
jgi:hypothetical protein